MSIKDWLGEVEKSFGNVGLRNLDALAQGRCALLYAEVPLRHVGISYGMISG